MSQYISAMGAIDASKFLLTSGVAKPRDFATLYIFQEMQHQLSRVAHGKNLPKVAPDGDVGPATVKIVTSTGPYASMSFQTPTVERIAASADAILAEAKSKADAMGVPEKVTTPVTVKPPAIVTPSGGTQVAPPKPVGAGASVMDTFKSLGTIGMLAAGAAVVGAGYYLTKKKGRR